MTRHLPVPRTSDNAETTRLRVALSPQLIDGDKALTTQTFTELNSKSGSQFEAAIYEANLASGETADVIVQTGDDPLIFKDVIAGFDGDHLSTQWFRNPDYTGGSEIPAYAFNDEGADPQLFTLLGGATVADPGTPVGPKIHTIGTDGQANRRVSTVSEAVGVERILASNAVYLFRFTNENNSDTRLTAAATWYQGPLSTNVELVV